MRPHEHAAGGATAADAASPAAMDEVFAMLARDVERIEESRSDLGDTVAHEAAGTDVGTIPSLSPATRSASVDSTTLRSLGEEMDRQHERLAQLLRDIEGTDASE